MLDTVGVTARSQSREKRELLNHSDDVEHYMYIQPTKCTVSLSVSGTSLTLQLRPLVAATFEYKVNGRDQERCPQGDFPLDGVDGGVDREGDGQVLALVAFDGEGNIGGLHTSTIIATATDDGLKMGNYYFWSTINRALPSVMS